MSLEARSHWLALLRASATLLLVAGCAGSQVSMPEPLTVLETRGPGLSLPPPDELRVPADVGGEYLKLGVDYEEDLPHEHVYTRFGKLCFSPDWSDEVPGRDELAYAMFWLKVPEYEHTPMIQWQSSGKDLNEDYWIGLANFRRGTWDWLPAKWQDAFTEDHITSGFLLLVVVSIHYGLELEWLIAGDLRPPFIWATDPELVMTGAQTTFAAKQYSSYRAKYRDDPESGRWYFGGGAAPEVVPAIEPLVTIGAPGEYTGEVTLSNASGSFTFGFDYTVVEECDYEPQHLYAVPDKTALHVGEEALITIISGDFPEDRPFACANMGMTIESGADFVFGSLNAGAPGGDKYDMDGVWTPMADNSLGFLDFFEEFISAQGTGIPGLNRFGFGLNSCWPPIVTDGGEICNFRFVFTEPGVYTLGFQEFYSIGLTWYGTPDGGEEYWYDVSNIPVPQIVVTD